MELFFVIWCYTATGYTQCQKQDNLPNAAACATVTTRVKAQAKAGQVVRQDACVSYPVPQSAALPADVLTAR